MFEAAAVVAVVAVETVGAAAAAEVVAVAAVVAAAESAAAGVFDATVAVEVIETAVEVLGVVEVLEVEAAAAAEAATSAAEPPRRPPPAGRKRPTSHSCRALELACGQQRWQREQQLKVRTALRSTEVDEGQLPELMLLQSPPVLELCRASAATPSPPPQFAVAPARWRCPADWWSQSRRRRPRF